jgi:transposase
MEKKGRPSKLTKTQKSELYKIIEAGPDTAGYPGGCWRSPMIQHLIQKKFGVFFSVKYVAELLKSIGLSFQKASFESAFLDEKKREEWLKQTWPEIMEKSRQLDSWIMFGDEASFPMWGSLSYTWAPRGKQPKVKTAGQRKGYKIFGAIEYWSGKFYYQAIEDKFSSETYISFLKMILSKTRKTVILIQDGAPYHKSAAVMKFIESSQRLLVYSLPSYSPDYNPIEKLWKKIKQNGVHLKYFPTFEKLKEAVDDMLEIMESAQEEILVLFGFYQRRSE